MDDDWRPGKHGSRRGSRRGKCFLLILVALFCFAASYFAYAADITADAHRSSLIIGAFLGIVNFTLIICIIGAAVLLMADINEG